MSTSCSICPAPARRRRSQPRVVAAGTPSSAPSRAEPVPRSTDREAARAITPAESDRRGTVHDGSAAWTLRTVAAILANPATPAVSPRA
jgi:hypothetical protein